MGDSVPLKNIRKVGFMFIINILSKFVNVSPILSLFSAFACFGVCLCVKKLVMNK